MASKKGRGKKMSEALLKKTAAIYQKHAGNVSATARELNLARSTIQERLRSAVESGFLEPFVSQANETRFNPFPDIVAKRKNEFIRARRAGTWRTIRKVKLPHDNPYTLLLLGDPHLDNPGTDLDLWEKWCNRLDAKNGVYGICLGDYLDNWVRPLAFLYAAAETTAPEGYTLLEEYLNRYGEHLVGSVSGNHDDWSGYSDTLSNLMRAAGVKNHRLHALRLGIESSNGRQVTVGLRHRFPGHSQWNTAHAVMKAAKMGWRDHILAGGDKHISGDGEVKDPDSGFITHCYQVASFKIYDDYAEEKGFLDQHIGPAVALVVNPSRADDDPALVTHFDCPDDAILFMEALRSRKPNR